MKHSLVLLIVFFLGCQPDGADSTPKNEEHTPTILDTIQQAAYSVPDDVREKLESKGMKDLPGSKWQVRTPFDTFEKGQVLTITTREGKEGYPFCEPIGGEYVYWVTDGKKVVPIKTAMLELACKKYEGVPAK